MKTQSAKAKGRRLQQTIREDLRKLGRPFDLVDGDIESRGMGQSGVDVILSPAAKKVFDLAIEAKNVEKLNVSQEFFAHYAKYQHEPSLKLLVHSKNRSRTLVTMTWEDFLWLLEKALSRENVNENVG